MGDSEWLQWMPVGLRRRQDGWVVDWCFFEGIRATDPFFYQTVGLALSDPARALFRRETPVEFLGGFARENPGIPPTGFIFHLSRCGSTVVSRTLASLTRNLVVSEPPALDQILQLAEGGALGPPDSAREILRGMVGAIGQPRNGESSFFIKFDSWHVRELPMILGAFPGVPWIFLYRDPVEILVSQLRMAGIQMVPGIIDPRRLGLDPGTTNPGSPGEYTARVLAQLCEAALDHGALGRGLYVNYSQLPGAIQGAIARHFALQLSPEECSTLAEAARFDAKAPSFTFEEDSERKQGEATGEIRQLALTWLAEPYRRLESIRLRQD